MWQFLPTDKPWGFLATYPMNVEKVTVKYDGESLEINASDLELNPNNPSDSDVLRAVGMEVGSDDMSGYRVDPPEAERLAGRHDTKTVLNVRPDATFA